MADFNVEHEHDTDRRDASDLEAELASFQPRAISSELRGRIGSDLADRRPRMRIAAALAGLAAVAACVTVALVLSRGGGGGEVAVPVPPVRPPDVVVTAAGADRSPPTLMEYQRAVAGSPAALDELLAWPAGRGRRVQRTAGQDVVTAFTRSAPLLNTTTNGDPL